jgi:hypothetical protein
LPSLCKRDYSSLKTAVTLQVMHSIGYILPSSSTLDLICNVGLAHQQMR